MAKKTETKTKPAASAKRATKPVVKKKAPAAKTTKPAAKPAKPKAPAFTNDDVALRAYFIAEKRQSLGLPGDEHSDWVEAERQLVAEAAPKKKTKKA